VHQISRLDVKSSEEGAAAGSEAAVEQAAQLHASVEYLACLVQVGGAAAFALLVPANVT
jgi:hypothetical protein